MAGSRYNSSGRYPDRSKRLLVAQGNQSWDHSLLPGAGTSWTTSNPRRVMLAGPGMSHLPGDTGITAREIPRKAKKTSVDDCSCIPDDVYLVVSLHWAPRRSQWDPARKWLCGTQTGLVLESRFRGQSPRCSAALCHARPPKGGAWALQAHHDPYHWNAFS